MTEKDDDFTTIQLTFKTKGKLDARKVHDREPYEDVLVRLLEEVEK